jgi:hypothetical protein
MAATWAFLRCVCISTFTVAQAKSHMLAPCAFHRSLRFFVSADGRPLLSPSRLLSAPRTPDAAPNFPTANSLAPFPVIRARSITCRLRIAISPERRFIVFLYSGCGAYTSGEKQSELYDLSVKNGPGLDSQVRCCNGADRDQKWLNSPIKMMIGIGIPSR